MESTNPSQVCRCHQRAFFDSWYFFYCLTGNSSPKKVPRSAISIFTKMLDLPNQIAELLIIMILL